MNEKSIGVVGAESFVGERICLTIQGKGNKAEEFSRERTRVLKFLSIEGSKGLPRIEEWVYVAPIWTFLENAALLERCAARKVVVLSSTSRFTKKRSASFKERRVADSLIQGEEQALQWARKTGCQLTILQPTLIYGYGRDRNISQIARFIRRYKFFPLIGKGSGMRQPVHVDDVAGVAVAALSCSKISLNSYVISGREAVSYKLMVERIFYALGQQPRILELPATAFKTALRFARLLPPYRDLTVQMALRMNEDLVFDHKAARDDLGFYPRPFRPVSNDVLDFSG